MSNSHFHPSSMDWPSANSRGSTRRLDASELESARTLAKEICLFDEIVKPVHELIQLKRFSR